MCALVLSCSIVSDSFRPHGLQPARVVCPWFPRQTYWSRLPFPSPGTFPTQGLNPSLLHWRVCMLSCSVLSNFCDLVDCSLPGSFVRGIFQARILEWVVISSSRGCSWPRGWNPSLLHWQAASLPLSQTREATKPLKTFVKESDAPDPCWKDHSGTVWMGKWSQH